MKYFSVEELCKSDTARQYNIDNTPTLYIRSNIVRLIEKYLDKIREMYGKPIYINSGYRCDELNKIVGGSPTSSHLKGLAADLDTRLGFEENKKLFKLIMNNFDFDQLIDENNLQWIHIGINEDNRHQVLKLKNGKYIDISKSTNNFNLSNINKCTIYKNLIKMISICNFNIFC